jgi:acyl-[acyl-carrier-protein] desaturase
LLTGIKRVRQVPTEAGAMRDTAVLDTLDYGEIEKKVRQLFGRIDKFEQETGHAEISPLVFLPSGLSTR